MNGFEKGKGSFFFNKDLVLLREVANLLESIVLPFLWIFN